MEVQEQDTKQCPYCGETIKAKAKKCRFCGQWLDKTETEKQPEVPRKKQCPYCGEAIKVTAKKCMHCKSWLIEMEQESLKYCPFCRKPVSTQAEKCPHCGEWLNDEPSEYSRGMWIGNPVVMCINGLWIFLGVLFLLTGIANGDEVFWICIFAAIFGYIGTYIYMFPSILAASRQHPQFLPILLINLFFGETIIGWIGALIWATTHRQGRHTHW